jgi:hypothetical protein
MMEPREVDEPWWDDLDAEVIACLTRHGACSPSDVARHLGLPEPATISLLCLLAQQGRITIRLVEYPAAERESRSRVA